MLLLQGLQLLDVGCGGGILSESLARLGARVRGIDITEQNVGVARAHAAQDPVVLGRVRCVMWGRRGVKHADVSSMTGCSLASRAARGAGMVQHNGW
jgi:ribosomal protein L11 methylase PrmA